MNDPKETQKLLAEEGYKSDEDLENLNPSNRYSHNDKSMITSISKSKEISQGDGALGIGVGVLPTHSEKGNNSIINSKNNSRNSIKKEEKRESINNSGKSDFYLCKKILNIITLILLLFTFAVPYFHALLENQLNTLHDYFKLKTVHFQINFGFFLIIWGITSLVLIVSIVRHSFYCTDDIFEAKEIKMVITRKLAHYFYFGNIILASVSFFWKYKSLQEYGVILFLALLSSIFYVIPFFKLKKTKLSNSQKFISLNKIGFYYTLSILMAFSHMMFILAAFTTIEMAGVLSIDSIELISFTVHGVIFCGAILILVFFRDFAYVLMILLFQLGIVVMNREKYTADNKFTLIFTLLTAVCYVFSLLFGKDDLEEDKEDLEIKYNEEKIREGNVL
jgi:hypothetical protein